MVLVSFRSFIYEEFIIGFIFQSDCLIGMLLISRSGLVEENAVEVFRYYGVNLSSVGLGGLGVKCSPRDPRFASSNPGEVDGFFQDVKILNTIPPGGTLSWGSRVTS